MGMTDEQYARYEKARVEARKTCVNAHDNRGMINKGSGAGIELWIPCPCCAAVAMQASGYTS